MSRPSRRWQKYWLNAQASCSSFLKLDACRSRQASGVPHSSKANGRSFHTTSKIEAGHLPTAKIHAFYASEKLFREVALWKAEEAADSEFGARTREVGMTASKSVASWALGTVAAVLTAFPLMFAQSSASAEPLTMWERSGGNESFVDLSGCGVERKESRSADRGSPTSPRPRWCRSSPRPSRRAKFRT